MVRTHWGRAMSGAGRLPPYKAGRHLHIVASLTAVVMLPISGTLGPRDSRAAGTHLLSGHPCVVPVPHGAPQGSASGWWPAVVTATVREKRLAAVLIPYTTVVWPHQGADSNRIYAAKEIAQRADDARSNAAGLCRRSSNDSTGFRFIERAEAAPIYLDAVDCHAHVMSEA